MNEVAALRRATPVVRRILEDALSGTEVSRDDGETLFRTQGDDLAAVLVVADAVRKVRVGERVSFVTVRNINFTNVCYMACKFCNFGVHRDAPQAQWLSLDEVASRAQEAWLRGGTEVCIQGGLHPDLPADYYHQLVTRVKARVPRMHIHAFSPFEIWYGSKKARTSPRQFLGELKALGLGTIPGTAAEILDQEIRLQLTRNKLSAEEWVSIIRDAHAVGLRSTATIMYGHIDGPSHWASHIELIRSIQKDTGGFTEFVPLGFIHDHTRLFHEHEHTRPGPSIDEHLKMHAVARLMLAGQIDNIQVSWVKLGPELAQRILNCGANDMGGTLMNESISRAAGAKYGQEITPLEMVEIIRGAGRVPVQRDTLYRPLDVFDDHDPPAIPPLVDRAEGVNPIAFLRRETPASETLP